MEYYTIKQLADEFHVTPQAIRFVINKSEYQSYLSKQKVNDRKTTVLDQNGYELLSKHFTKAKNKKQNNDFSKKQKTKNKIKNKNNNYQILLDMIATLKKELDSVHTELQHEQELHLIDKKQIANDKQKIILLENQIKEMTLLKEKQSKKQNEKIKDKENDNEEDIKKEPPTKKSWWQFWK